MKKNNLPIFATATVGSAAVVALSINAYSKNKRAVTPNDDDEECTSPKEQILIHSGKSAQFLKYGFAPRVETFTLASGWTSETSTKFTHAIKSVVQENPILTSHLVWNTSDQSVYACPGTFPADTHEFVSVISMDGTTSDDRDGHDLVDVSQFETHEARLAFMDQVLAPLVGSRDIDKPYASEDIQTKRPLFHAHLFQFPNGHVCYHIGISHALADAHTYYLLVHQISCFMNDVEITKIRWDNPLMPEHESDPDHYTDKDQGQMGMMSILSGFVFYKLRSSWKQKRNGTKKEHTWVVPKQYLLDQKKEQLDTSITPFISSHDILFSTISRLLQSSTQLMITMDHRKRSPNKSFLPNDGGNCFKMFAIPTSVSSNPNHFRTALNNGYYYPANELDIKSTLAKGRMCYATSWATGYKSIDVVGQEIICHCPSFAFIRSFPADFCVIFHLDDDNLGVIHSMMEIDEDRMGDLLKEWDMFGSA